MKFVLFCIGLLCLNIRAAETMLVPITGTAEIPVSTNAPITIITNVITIITNVTQIITNGEISNPFVTLQDDVVNASLGKRLVRFVQGPSNFTTRGFGADGYASLYIINPGHFPLNFPNTAWWMGPRPTNQARVVVLIESISGELWWTP